MSNWKDRIQTDINSDHVLHFFEKILTELFQNPPYSLAQPAHSLLKDINVNEYPMWDPNKITALMNSEAMQRSGNQAQQERTILSQPNVDRTEVCLRKKQRKSLTKAKSEVLPVVAW